LLGLDRDLGDAADVEDLGGLLHLGQDEAELHADGVDVDLVALARVGLDGDAVEAHDQPGDAPLDVVDDLLQGFLEHRRTLPYARAKTASTDMATWRHGDMAT